MSVVGTVESIWRYPVKSLAGQSLAEAAVETSGIVGDRVKALFVRDGHPRTGKTFRGKEHDRLHLSGDPAAARKLGADAGIDLELRDGDRYFDDAPVSLLVDRWLAELRAHVGYAVEPQRFRPNFFVRADPAFHDGEAALGGLRLAIGGVVLRVRYPIERCVVTTYDPNGGLADPRILRFVAQERNACMGVYCDVIAPGIVRVGDVLSALSPG